MHKHGDASHSIYVAGYVIDGCNIQQLSLVSRRVVSMQLDNGFKQYVELQLEDNLVSLFLVFYNSRTLHRCIN